MVNPLALKSFLIQASDEPDLGVLNQIGIDQWSIFDSVLLASSVEPQSGKDVGQRVGLEQATIYTCQDAYSQTPVRK